MGDNASTFGHSGGCRCGAIRFEASSEPFHASYCHCTDCRRASGAPVAAFVGFWAEDVTFHGAAAATYGVHPIARRFCATCGAPLAYTDARIADQIFFMLGAMDHPEQYPPRLHGHIFSQLPFLHMDDGLPRTDGATAPRPSEEA
jgi:hypothetical protein